MILHYVKDEREYPQEGIAQRAGPRQSQSWSVPYVPERDGQPKFSRAAQMQHRGELIRSSDVFESIIFMNKGQWAFTHVVGQFIPHAYSPAYDFADASGPHQMSTARGMPATSTLPSLRTTSLQMRQEETQRSFLPTRKRNMRRSATNRTRDQNQEMNSAHV